MQSAVGGKWRAHTMVGQGKTREYGGGGFETTQPQAREFSIFQRH